MLVNLKNSRFHGEADKRRRKTMSKASSHPISIATILLLGASIFVISAGSVLVAYLSTVNGFTFQPGDLGTLGDFVGGLLNPFLTFISIGFIAFTLYQNSSALKLSAKELELTREEMSLIRIEHAKTAAAQEGLFTLESKNIAARQLSLKIENTKHELDLRHESLKDKLRLREFYNNPDEISVFSFLEIMNTERNEIFSPDGSSEALDFFVDLLKDVCLIGEVLNGYIKNKNDEALGRGIYIELGDTFNMIDEGMSDLSFFRLD